jgi:hypothetical protein
MKVRPLSGPPRWSMNSGIYSVSEPPLLKFQFLFLPGSILRSGARAQLALVSLGTLHVSPDDLGLFRSVNYQSERVPGRSETRVLFKKESGTSRVLTYVWTTSYFRPHLVYIPTGGSSF